MERFFKRKISEKSYSEPEVQSSRNENYVQVSNPPSNVPLHQEINFEEFPADPAMRKNIYDYDANEIEKVRRTYLQKGPCQPKYHVFPWRQVGNDKRRFIPAWFSEYGSWLEYSIEKDAAYCLFCYLFKHVHGEQGGGDSFVGEGFTNWKNKEKLKEHVGNHNSIHNKCLKACEDLMNQKQHIEVCFSNQSEQARIDYRTRLTASFDCLKYLLRQGLAIRGHDESEGSTNQGNFLELLQFLAEHNDNINQVVLKNAPENHKMIAPSIQKEIINAAAVATTNAIIRDIGNEVFSILVDESRDISVKEQMALALRYVDTNGCVIERFLGIVHVGNTTALSLKAAIKSLFSKHGLSMSSIRGQGYDGASNMQGEFNGLKSLIMMENKSAFYVHCFAHQLQLTLVVVSKKHKKIGSFFNQVAILSNIVGASCKRRDILREKQFEKIVEGIYSGEIVTGRGLNQETTLKRAGDTRWGSHFGTLMSLVCLFSSVIDVLEVIEEDGTAPEQRAEAHDLLDTLQCFEFSFKLHLMKAILGITNDLSQALQKKDQDVVNAMGLVKVSKWRLQNMRDNGWDNMLNEVSLFCNKHEILIPNMGDLFVYRGRSRRNAQEMTNLHYYRVELFYTVIDMQLQELNNRFNEVNTELILCMACLDPSNSFMAFDKEKLLRFAQFYPADFSPIELMALDYQLENFVYNVRFHDQFSGVKGISGLAQTMVKCRMNENYPLVYLLVKLALVLPVATATVERAFSAMKIIKSSLRNRMGDEFMNDCLVTYIEQDIFNNIDTEAILQHFQNMKPRRGLL